MNPAEIIESVAGSIADYVRPRHQVPLIARVAYLAMLDAIRDPSPELVTAVAKAIQATLPAGVVGNRHAERFARAAILALGDELKREVAG